MGSKILLCVRIDEDIYKLIEAIKEEYGIDKSVVVRLAVSWFVPAFALALEHFKLSMVTNLDKKIIEILKSGLERYRYHL